MRACVRVRLCSSPAVRSQHSHIRPLGAFAESINEHDDEIELLLVLRVCARARGGGPLHKLWARAGALVVARSWCVEAFWQRIGRVRPKPSNNTQIV
eukprot:1385191-Pleurochrysis_carterae.AAC.3